MKQFYQVLSVAIVLCIGLVVVSILKVNHYNSVQAGKNNPGKKQHINHNKSVQIPLTDRQRVKILKQDGNTWVYSWPDQ
jgi:hypothetical protein